MERSKIKIWTPSGCLSKEAIAAWYGNSFSRSEKYVIKLHLDECPFCKDAVEGYSLLSPEQTQQNLDDIKERFNITILGEVKKTRFLSRRLIISSAAAFVLAFIGIYSFIKFLPERKTLPLAQNIQTEAKQKAIANNESAGSTINETARPVVRESTPPVTKPKADYAANSYVTDSVVEMPAPANEVAAPAPTMDETAEVAQVEEEKSLYKEESAGYVSKRQLNERRAEQAIKADKPASYKKMGSPVAENSPEDKPAVFKYGDSNFKAYVEQKLAKAIKYKQASPGNLTVSFSIDINGEIQNIVIEKGIDNKTNLLVTGIMSNSPEWIPAQQNGKAIESHQVIILEGK